jgi:hypothetical protein
MEVFRVGANRNPTSKIWCGAGFRRNILKTDEAKPEKHVLRVIFPNPRQLQELQAGLRDSIFFLEALKVTRTEAPGLLLSKTSCNTSQRP